ncbi:MAG: efflux transporter outer membrane subunit [Verrucomicrobia bacterium]|nr:MAG: efflux transporter outer membrane subunit [Verrucomicrobiota bacterium]
MNPKPFFSTLAALTLLTFAGCAVGPSYRQPKTPEPAAFGNATSTTNGEIETNWWRGFNDETLQRLILFASTNNHDLRLAQARLHEARALWTAARFDYAPAIRSDNYYENLQTSIATQPNKSRHERSMELYRVGFDATWELDLWGRSRRSVEAARATVESVAASRDDVLVSVRAEVAVNYLELRGIQALLSVARRNATNQSDIVKLAEALRDGGQGTQLDVARARSLMNTTLATVPPLETAQEKAIHRLSVLCGQQPTALRGELISPKPLPVRGTDFAIGNPTELLRRRPDVRAAERSLAASTANIGVEVGNLFPAMTFVGSIGLQANHPGDLGKAGTTAWGFGPHLTWAAFDLGRVRQQIRAANARAEGSLTIYEKTVLLALEETENSLVTFGHERQRLGYLREAERTAAEAVELARQRYRDGVADFLSVLDAERTLLDLQEQLVQSETRTATSLVAVYKSLGGGVTAK